MNLPTLGFNEPEYLLGIETRRRGLRVIPRAGFNEPEGSSEVLV